MGKENLGNVVVSETLDGTIFNGTDEEIKNKMLALVTREYGSQYEEYWMVVKRIEIISLLI